MILFANGLAAIAQMMAVLVVFAVVCTVVFNILAIITVWRWPEQNWGIWFSRMALGITVLFSLLLSFITYGCSLILGIVPFSFALLINIQAHRRRNEKLSILSPTLEKEPNKKATAENVGSPIFLILSVMVLVCVGSCLLTGPALDLVDYMMTGRWPTPIKQKDVVIGMTTEEVLAKFGQPNEKRYRKDCESWYYNQGGLSGETILVEFKNNHVYEVWILD